MTLIFFKAQYDHKRGKCTDSSMHCYGTTNDSLKVFQILIRFPKIVISECMANQRNCCNTQSIHVCPINSPIQERETLSGEYSVGDMEKDAVGIDGRKRRH